MLRIGVFVSTVLLALSALSASAQERTVTMRLDKATLVQPHNVTVKAVRYHDRDVLEIRQIGEARGFDLDTFAFVPGLDFHDGTIELDVAGTPPRERAPGSARFHRGCIPHRYRRCHLCVRGIRYIRPTNGRAEDQVRRNHSTQYFSYPGYDFDRLRRDAPGQYESDTDLVPGEWTHLRVEVSGATARFYVGAAAQPVLIVQDMKHGPDAHGAVGLFVGSGTDGHFRNLSVRMSAQTSRP